MGEPKERVTNEVDNALENSLMSLKILNSWDENSNVFEVYGNGKGQEILYADLYQAVQHSESEVKYTRLIASPDGLILLSDNITGPLPKSRVIEIVEMTKLKKGEQVKIGVDTKFPSKAKWDFGTEDYYSYKLSYYPHGLIGLQVRDMVRGKGKAQKLRSLIELQGSINRQRDLKKEDTKE